MLSDNFWYGEGSIEDDDELYSASYNESTGEYSKGAWWMDYNNLVVMDVNVGPYSPVQPTIDSNYVEVKGKRNIRKREFELDF